MEVEPEHEDSHLSPDLHRSVTSKNHLDEDTGGGLVCQTTQVQKRHSHCMTMSSETNFEDLGASGSGNTGDWRSERHLMQATMNTLTWERDNLAETVRTLSTTNKALEASVDELEQCLNQEKLQKAEAVKLQRKLDSELRSSHEGFSSLEKSVKEAEKKVLHLSKELRFWQDQAEEHKRAVVDEKKRTEQIHRDMEELTEELLAANNQRSRLEAQCKQRDAEIEDISERLEDAEQMLRMRQDLADKREQELKQIRTDFEICVMENEAAVAKLKKKLGAETDKVEELTQKFMTTNQHLEKQNLSLREEIHSVSNHVDALIAERVVLLKDISVLKAALKKAKQDQEEQSKTVEKLKNEGKSEQVERASLIHQNKELTGMMKDVETQRNVTVTKLHAAHDQVSSLKVENSELRRRVRSLVTEMKNFQLMQEDEEIILRQKFGFAGPGVATAEGRKREDEALGATVSVLEEEKSLLLAKVSQLQDLNDALKAEVAKASNTKQRMLLKFNECQANLWATEEKLAGGQKRSRVLEQRMSDLERQLGDRDRRLRASKDDYTNCMKEVSSQRIRMGDLVETVASYKEENARLRSQNNESLHKLAVERNRSKHSEERTQIQEKDIKELHRALKEASAALFKEQDKKRDLEDKHQCVNAQWQQKLQEVMQQSNLNLDGKDQEILDLRGQLKCLTDDCSQLSSTKRKLEEAVTKLETDLDQLSQEYSETKDHLSLCQKKMFMWNREVADKSLRLKSQLKVNSLLTREVITLKQVIDVLSRGQEQARLEVIRQEEGWHNLVLQLGRAMKDASTSWPIQLDQDEL